MPDALKQVAEAVAALCDKEAASWPVGENRKRWEDRTDAMRALAAERDEAVKRAEKAEGNADRWECAARDAWKFRDLTRKHANAAEGMVGDPERKWTESREYAEGLQKEVADLQSRLARVVELADGMERAVHQTCNVPASRARDLASAIEAAPAEKPVAVPGWDDEKSPGEWVRLSISPLTDWGAEEQKAWELIARYLDGAEPARVKAPRELVDWFRQWINRRSEVLPRAQAVKLRDILALLEPADAVVVTREMWDTCYELLDLDCGNAGSLWHCACETCKASRAALNISEEWVQPETGEASDATDAPNADAATDE